MGVEPTLLEIERHHHPAGIGDEQIVVDTYLRVFRLERRDAYAAGYIIDYEFVIRDTTLMS
jgi:hypothetical protein